MESPEWPSDGCFYFLGLLTLCGAVALILALVKAATWIIQHVHFT